jgi:hypothetical protein
VRNKTLNTPMPTSLLSREEVLMALCALGEDPSAVRINQLRNRVDASGLPDGDRAEGIRAAVDAARRQLDAGARAPKVPQFDQAAMADQIFADYDFGSGVEVTDTGGWEYSEPGFERTRKVYVETEAEDDGPAPRWTLTFTVRFDPRGGAPSEAYAIDSKGQIWGSLPREIPDVTVMADAYVAATKAVHRLESELLREIFSRSVLEAVARNDADDIERGRQSTNDEIVLAAAIKDVVSAAENGQPYFPAVLEFDAGFNEAWAAALRNSTEIQPDKGDPLRLAIAQSRTRDESDKQVTAAVWSDWVENPFKAIKAAAEARGTPADYDRALDVLRASAEWADFSSDHFLDDLLQEIAGETNIVCQYGDRGIHSARVFRAAYDEVPALVVVSVDHCSPPSM